MSIKLLLSQTHRPTAKCCFSQKSKHLFQIHILFASAFISCLDFKDQDARRLLMLLTDLMKDN